MSARPVRAHSGPWGRLKPVSFDYLESFGLTSKGDNRLLDFKTQERYYTKIVDRYMSFCSKAGRGDELSRQLSSLSISSESSASHEPTPVIPSVDSNELLSNSIQDVASSKDLSVLTMAMRKLREGIVGSKRVDSFSVQAYIFCIRLTILLKHHESYQPALLHLLRIMHTALPLSSVELPEFAGYLVLDLACRQQDLAQAYAIRNLYAVHDAKLDATLEALVHDNYNKFWKVKRRVDGYKAKLMEFADDAMRLQALKCLGRTYLVVDIGFLERATNSNWLDLQNRYGVGWQLDGTTVIIRKPKGR